LKQARTYRQVWRRDARWSLTGVITTEATVNCHSYIVTALLGSAAFAPIAATALFIRPITVVINALAEFERARAAHRFARSQTDLMALARRHMRLLLLAIWVSTAVLAAVVIAYAPQRFMVGKFGMAAVSSGTVLWLLVAMARLLHAPEGLILLAAGRFRQLAWISTWTAIVSVLSVLAIVLSGFTVSSIAGIVLGEGAFAFAAWRAASQLLSRANASSCPTG
jgi:putative peptidoglycan lipid II flippase